MCAYSSMYSRGPTTSVSNTTPRFSLRRDLPSRRVFHVVCDALSKWPVSTAVASGG
ncbi:hypothetical protein BofuT4_P153820.1 [Botrytis cinerea T4]|uniref:Uncharacterized protein n=1 Tax=Botryotinia fuckeliana (strain T4) TaxID=999810 RepID=G2YW22_BOTF4|nr:hypothetical protein BofuT4_P153820.1 [Botrytis cinerea T4]